MRETNVPPPDDPGDDAGPGEESGHDEEDDAGDEEAVEGDLPAGYAWDFERQEADLPPQEYRAHRAILDELEEDDLRDLDLGRAGDYVLWAAAQAFEEIGRPDEALPLLRRIAASASPHPALHYPDILLRLADLLKERGDYDEALSVLTRLEEREADLADIVGQRRGEVLVLAGRVEEGLRCLERAARAARDDPWVPLAAAWALLQRGEYDAARAWVVRAEKALRRVGDRAERAEAEADIERVRGELKERAARRAAPGPEGAAGFEARRRAILADLDAEEVLLVQRPPRDDPSRAAATERLAALHARASTAWDDAVVAGDEEAIAGFDDLQWEVVDVAGRFGLTLPGVEAG